jgi:DNA mismatch endonuclease, patch repair protein
MDVHDIYTRSFNMSRIVSKNTSIELIVRKFLFNHGFRYRLHYNKLPGKPDLVLIKHRIAIFVNGCYFHGHENCKLATTSSTRKDFWMGKINSNISRDKRNEDLLRKMNWTVFKIWECEIEPRKKYSLVREKNLNDLKSNIFNTIKNNDSCN